MDTKIIDTGDSLRRQAYRILQTILDRLELQVTQENYQITQQDAVMLRVCQQTLVDLRKDEREEIAKLDLASLPADKIVELLKNTQLFAPSDVGFGVKGGEDSVSAVSNKARSPRRRQLPKG